FIPVCLLGALFFQNLLIAQDNAFPTISTLHVFAALPTMAVAIFSKSLSWTVITGVVTMAFLRIYL
ncbi:AzlD domain-containing protein, partial [Exiguobacterium sp.]